MKTYSKDTIANSPMIGGLTAYSMAIMGDSLDDAIKVMAGFAEAINLLRFHPEILMAVESELDIDLIRMPDPSFQEYKAHLLADMLGFDIDPSLIETSKRQLEAMRAK